MQCWITKYALTVGIIKVEGKLSSISKDMISYKRHNADFEEYAHGKDWHKTFELAKERAEEMRVDKISSLLKQIAKLEKIKL